MTAKVNVRLGLISIGIRCLHMLNILHHVCSKIVLTYKKSKSEYFSTENIYMHVVTLNE